MMAPSARDSKFGSGADDVRMPKRQKLEAVSEIEVLPRRCTLKQIPFKNDKYNTKIVMFRISNWRGMPIISHILLSSLLASGFD
jgi:hypothetical protein